MVFVRAKRAILAFFISIVPLSLYYWSTASSSCNFFDCTIPYVETHLGYQNITDTWDSSESVTSLPPTPQCSELQDLPVPVPVEALRPWDSSYALLGLPTKGFRENLRPEKYYLTAWAVAGFTNQFMAFVNLIYLATISDRIPIIPPFAPSHHMPNSAGVIYFGDIFNLTHLRNAIQRPILEWREVKELPPLEDPYSSIDKEQIGCWSSIVRDHKAPFENGNMLNHVGLDISYTRVPKQVRQKEDENDFHVIFSELAALTYPGGPSSNPTDFPLTFPSRMNSKLPPDQHLACIDCLYFVTSGGHSFEWERPWSPAWNIIGKYLPFTERMMSLGKEYLGILFQVSLNDIPHFIAVHVRRGDFTNICPEGSCSHISKYAQQVQEVQEEILRKHGIAIQEVIITSDETDPEFWNQAKSFGWKRFDHDALKTAEMLGEWYPPLIDIVTHSMAVGFVGTIGSTYSLLSKRRVDDWNQGVTRLVNIF